MAETTPSPSLDAGNPTANVTFTFAEQATASLALYGLSLLCIVWGGINSASFVKRLIAKKRLVETSITISEARKFPLTASIVLFSLYIFFKPDGKEWLLGFLSVHLPAHISERLNKTLLPGEGSTSLFQKLEAVTPENAKFLLEYIPTITKQHFMYFLLVFLCFEGCVSLAAILKPIYQRILRLLPIGDRWPRKNTSYLLSLKKGKKEMDQGDIEDATKRDVEYLMKIEVDSHDIIGILMCIPVGISHLYRRHWVTNNLLGVAFSIFGIENLHLSSFKAGSLLLSGLFIYDIFWVFATDVMTSVAKGIDAPILLQFPQDIFQNGWLEASKHSMLGLGDIVIPGIFIALLRRFDQRLGEKSGEKAKGPLKGRYYFATTIIAYMLGLFITMAVMHHFKRAQPALLYLVPTCLLIPLVLAVIRGELSELWNYDEEHLIEKDEDSKKKKVSDDKKKN
ncbi:unnamed protein product, partial [Mesorhabditis belari]|uniref:Uncharacterized protein n=1 Tax=Mesorhabditis belari TaxID=2138241 RepID=A0AAF3FFI7_9BILA